MNPTEAVALCRLAKACCPQQAFDEYTPDAWAEILGHLEFADCKAALFKLAGERPFVAPAEIKAEVRRVRHDRLLTFGPIPPPRHIDPEDTGAYQQWHYETTKAIADGTLTRDMVPEPDEEPAAITAAMRELRRKAAENARDGLGRPKPPAPAAIEAGGQ